MERPRLLRSLLLCLWLALIAKVRREHEAWLAEAQNMDLGDDDCPVCLRVRERSETA